MRDYSRTITANSSVSAGVIGNFIKLKDSTSTVRIVAENKDGREVANLRMSVGTSIRISEQYQRVRIENETGSPVTCDLILGYGDVQDSELSGTITQSRGTRIENAVDTVNTTSKKILNSDSTRRSLVLLNTDAANVLYVGGSGVTAANGLPLIAGQSIVLDHSPSGEVWAIGSAAGIVVKILSEHD